MENDPAITALSVVALGSLSTAVLALSLSITPWRVAARHCARISLWLAIAGTPLALIADIAVPLWVGNLDAVPVGTRLARTLAQLKSFGILLLPAAAIAGMALRRANAPTRR